MEETIYEKDSTLYFNHDALNQLTAKGEQSGKAYLTTMIVDSAVYFKLIKNYEEVRKIAETKWKVQKPELQVFKEKICASVQSINAQYYRLQNKIK